MNAVGVDVGGTKIAAGVVSPEGRLLNEVTYPTADVRERLLSTIAEAITEVQGGYEVGGVCLAVPGFILAFVTLGTGVGGGVISHGVLLRGARDMGGELGHITVQPAGPRCGCGNHGCLEALASGTAIARRAREVADQRPDSALGKFAMERTPLGEDVLDLARKGDETALEVLQEAGTWLGIGLATFLNLFDPEVIAIGGGLSEAGDLVLEPARRELRLRSTSPSRDLVEIRKATLGARSGMLGAAALARGENGEYVLKD